MKWIWLLRVRRGFGESALGWLGTDAFTLTFLADQGDRATACRRLVAKPANREMAQQNETPRAADKASSTTDRGPEASKKISSFYFLQSALWGCFFVQNRTLAVGSVVSRVPGPVEADFARKNPEITGVGVFALGNYDGGVDLPSRSSCPSNLWLKSPTVNGSSAVRWRTVQSDHQRFSFFPLPSLSLCLSLPSLADGE